MLYDSQARLHGSVKRAGSNRWKPHLFSFWRVVSAPASAQHGSRCGPVFDSKPGIDFKVDVGDARLGGKVAVIIALEIGEHDAGKLCGGRAQVVGDASRKSKEVKTSRACTNSRLNCDCR